MLSNGKILGALCEKRDDAVVVMEINIFFITLVSMHITVHSRAALFSTHLHLYRKHWTSNLTGCSVMAWCTYDRIVPLVHQQVSCHTHPSAVPEGIFTLMWHRTFNMPTHQIIAVCIEHTTVLWTTNTCITCQVKACLAIHCWTDIWLLPWW